MKCRKSIYDLTPGELNDFVTAVQALKTNGTWNAFVKVHAEAMFNYTLLAGETAGVHTRRNSAHRGPAFLPWHRVFITKLEEALHAEVPGVTLPYWPWEEDAENFADPAAAPLWTAAYIGGTGSPVPDGPFAGWQTVEIQDYLSATEPLRDDAGNILFDEGAAGGILERNLGEFDFFPTQAQFDECINNFNFYDESNWDEDSDGLRNRLEGFLTIASDRPGETTVLHNSVHRWVAGDMLPATSPNDPVFFLHHCNVDRMWAKWQERQRAVNGNSYDAHYEPAAGGPTGHNVDDPMFPWEAELATPASTLDYSADMDFIYDDVPVVDLENDTLTFSGVPEDETTFRAAVFSVKACRDVTFEVTAGPTVDVGSAPGTSFDTPLGGSVVFSPPSSNEGKAYLWISYTGTNDADFGSGSVTIRGRLEKGGEVRWEREWTLSITADTVERPTAALMMVLDQSNSMNFDSGIAPGVTRGDVLKYSAPPVVDVITDGNALGIVTFDHDPHDVMGVTEMNLANRIIANGHLGGYGPNPNGWTSIGEAVARAHDHLAPEEHTVKAMVVLTDGRENHDGYDRRYISDPDIQDLINERVYAIGLGTVENIQPSALEALCDGNEGYLLMTGPLDVDAYFRLAKYYQQILASVLNNEVILDPEGWVRPGQERRISFRLNETDISVDVILLSPAPSAFKFYLESPSGDVIDPGVAAANPAITYMVGSDVSFYRLGLPVPMGDAQAREGTWYAVLTIDDREYKRYLARLENYPEEFQRARAHGVRYSLTVNAYSNLRFRARVSQDSYEPGARIALRAVLSEYGVPVEGRAKAYAELERPDATTATLSLTEVEPGVFETSTEASMSGIYRFRVLASGKTFRGRRFTREQTLTGVIWQGGDNPPPTSKDDPPKSDERLCRLLQCLLSEEAFGRYLKEQGINVKVIIECLKAYCESSQTARESGLISVRPEIAAALAEPRLQEALSALLRVPGSRE